MKVFAVRDKVFKVEPLFVVGCTHYQLRKYLRKKYKLRIVDEGQKLAGQMLTFWSAPWRVVWVRRKGDLECLAHEIFHLVTRICQDKGIPIVAHHPNGDNGDETAAYMLEHYIVKALKKIKKR